MKLETFFIVISFIFFFLSIYFAVLPKLYVTLNEQLRIQLLALATSFFVGGIVFIVSYAIVKISGRIFSEKDTRPPLF